MPSAHSNDVPGLPLTVPRQHHDADSSEAGNIPSGCNDAVIHDEGLVDIVPVGIEELLLDARMAGQLALGAVPDAARQSSRVEQDAGSGADARHPPVLDPHPLHELQHVDGLTQHLGARSARHDQHVRVTEQFRKQRDVGVVRRDLYPSRASARRG